MIEIKREYQESLFDTAAKSGNNAWIGDGTPSMNIWGRFNGLNTPSIIAGNGFKKIEKLARGIFRFYLVPTIKNASYGVIGNAYYGARQHWDPNWSGEETMCNIVVPFNLTDNTFDVKISDNDTDTLVDPEMIHIQIVSNMPALSGTSLEDSRIDTNGYQRLASGLLLQWGTVYIPLGRDIVHFSVIFPIPFTKELFNISGNYNGNARGHNGIYGVDAAFVCFEDKRLDGITGKVFERVVITDPIEQGWMDWFAIGI